MELKDVDKILDDIEYKICCHDITIHQVFTKLKWVIQHILIEKLTK